MICLSCYDRSKSSILSLRGLFVSVQMFFIDIFSYLNCLNLFKTNVTQQLSPAMKCIYSVRLIKSRLLQCSVSLWNRNENVFCRQNTVEIWKTNQRRSFSTSVRAKLEQGNHIITVRSSFQKALLWKVQLYVYICLLQLFSHILSILLCLKLISETQSVTGGQWIDARVRLIMPGPS